MERTIRHPYGRRANPGVRSSSNLSSWTTARARNVRRLSISPDGKTLSLVACVSDSELLRCNLLASPCLDPRFHHDVTVVKNCPSSASGLNLGLERAGREFVVCVHQDVYLPAGWNRWLMHRLQEAERRFGPIGVAGVYGVGEVIETEDSRQPLRRTHRLGCRSRPVAPRWPGAAGPGRDPRRAAAGRATRFGAAVRSGSGLSSLRSRHPLAGPRTRFSRRRRWRRSAITIPVALGCRRRFTGARRSSLANGAIGYRLPRLVSSSTATARSTPSATRPARGRDQLHTPCHVCDTRPARKRKRMFTTEAQSSQRGIIRHVWNERPPATRFCPRNRFIVLIILFYVCSVYLW